MSLEKKTGGGANPRVKAGDHRPVRILVVDDDGDGRLAISRVLNMVGYDVAAVADVASALDQLSRSHFDLIISDLRMPGRTGLDLLEEVHRSNMKTPFLLLSAATDRDSRSIALRLGAADFLEKPVHREALLQKINRALGV